MDEVAKFGKRVDLLALMAGVMAARLQVGSVLFNCIADGWR
jgi:hypothetical protein